MVIVTNEKRERGKINQPLQLLAELADCAGCNFHIIPELKSSQKEMKGKIVRVEGSQWGVGFKIENCMEMTCTKTGLFSRQNDFQSSSHIEWSLHVSAKTVNSTTQDGSIKVFDPIGQYNMIISRN